MNTPPHLKCFQFFFSWIIFVMTSGSMCASLKKGTTRACPENGKTHSQKTRFPVLGTSTQRFLAWGQNYFVGCPKFGKTHSQKTRFAILGTVAMHFGAKLHIFCLEDICTFGFLHFLRAYMM